MTAKDGTVRSLSSVFAGSLKILLLKLVLCSYKQGIDTLNSLDEGNVEIASGTAEDSDSMSISELNHFHVQLAAAVLQGYSLKEIAACLNMKESTSRKEDDSTPPRAHQGIARSAMPCVLLDQIRLCCRFY
jgi:hypothetical protein